MSNWVSVDDEKPEYDIDVLVIVVDVTKQVRQFVAKLQLVPQHAFENSPKHDRWYAVPGWGHEVKPTHWQELPAAPED